MKALIFILMFIGMVLITFNSIGQTNTCPQKEIIYKYIPRTFEEEQNEPVYPSDIFKTMFTQQSPWVRSIQGTDARRAETINKYFISQQ